MHPSAVANLWDIMASVPLAGFVLAAGLGTRIGALSRRRPKPLLPVGLETPLSLAVSALRAGGAQTVVANASHLAEQVVDAGRRLEIDVVVERDGPLGTAGGLAAARPRLDADAVAIWTGDIVADLDVAALHAALEGPALAALAVRDLRAPGQGNVGLDEDGRVVRLRDRSFGRETRGASFAAVHVVSREIVARAPSRGCLVGDVYLPLLEAGARLVAVPTDGRWHDIGDVPSYLAANLATIDEREKGLVGRGAVVAPGIELDRAVLGEAARVDGAGLVREAVVWPGVRATAPLARAIVVADAEIVPA